MNKFFSKIAIGIASFAMVVGVGVAVATQQVNPVYADDSISTLTFSAAPKSGDTLKATQNDEAQATYVWTTDSEYISADTDGEYKSIHSGSSSKQCSYQKYASASFSGYLIKSVKFRAKSNGSSPACAVSINGEKIGSKSLTNSYQDLTITNPDEKQGGYLNIDFTMSKAKKNIMVSYIQVTYVSNGGGNDDPIALTNPNPQYDDEDRIVTWTKDTNATKYQIKVDSGSYTDIETDTYDARGLTADEEHTVAIKAVGDETKFTSTEGSVKFTPTVYEIHRKFTIASTSSVTERGDAITGATASYSQTYYGNDGIGKATKDHSMTLTITGLTKKVSINKLVLSMKSNTKEGSGSVAVIIDGGEAKYIAGTSPSGGVAFNAFGDSTSYSTTFKKVTWKDLSFVAKESIEIKIYCSVSSLYCEYFNIFFSEEENRDYVTALSVTPNTWSGYTTSLLKVEDFKVSATTGDGEGTEADYVCLGIGHMEDGEFVARDDRFFIGYPEVTDTRLYWKAKYPTAPGGSTYLYTYVTLNVSQDTLKSVQISKDMEKLSYYTTDRWDFRGLESTAVYESGTTQDVTYRADYTFFSDAGLTEEVKTPADLGVGNNKTVYVKATYEGVSNTEGYAQLVDVSYEHGYLITDPLTADEAIGIGSKFGNGGETEPQYYIRGTVTSVLANQLDQQGKNKYATFFLEESDEKFSFEAYKIAPNENCTNYEDLKVGAVVLLRCRIKNYLNTTIENGSLGELVSISYAKAALEAIALNKNILYLGVNDQYTLTASALPLGADMGEVEWVSSDEKVAKIDKDGVVTAVAQGSATITATSSGFSAKCDVVVGVKATLEYKGSSSVYANAYTDSELTEALSLNNSMFNVSYDKNGASTEMNLNSDGGIRMYATAQTTNGNKFTVTVDDKYSISAIVISFVKNYSSETAEISTRSAIVEGKDGLYEINSNKFTVFNNNSKASNNTQVRISKIDIFYRDAVAAEKVERLTTQTSLAYNYDVDGEGNFTYSNIVMRFGAKISKDLWNELDTDKHVITGFGVMIADGDAVINDKDFAEAIEMATPSTEGKDLSTEVAIDYFVPVANMETTIGVEGDNYFWNLRFSVDTANIDKMYSAIAYVKVGDEYVVLNMARESVVTLAKDYIANRGYDATTAGGSLSNLAK